MKTWKTSHDHKVFQVLSGRSNAYLLRAGQYNILVDTGKKNAYKKLQQNIKSLLPDHQHIHFLILTHTHFDHCQNAATIKDKHQCNIIMSEHEAIFAKNGYTPLPNGTFLITRPISSLGKRLGKNRYGYEPFTPDILVNDAYDFNESGLNIKIITTRGHSLGSLSIIIDNEIAIVGDTLFGIFRNSVFPPYADKKNELSDSWKALLNTNSELFLPGHGKEISKKLLLNEYHKFVLSNTC